MAKYVVMFETNQVPEKGNCDYCELDCRYHMTAMDKAMYVAMRVDQRMMEFNDFYCPIVAYIDIESYRRWKQEESNMEEAKRLEVKD